MIYVRAFDVDGVVTVRSLAAHNRSEALEYGQALSLGE